jgi:hypothetical protein
MRINNAQHTHTITTIRINNTTLPSPTPPTSPTSPPPPPLPQNLGPLTRKKKRPPRFPYPQTTKQNNGGRRWPCSSSLPSPGGAGGHQMTGGRGPSSTHNSHYTIIKIVTTPHHHWGPVMGSLEGRECHFLPSPALFLPIAPQEVKQHQVPERGAVLLFFGRGKGGKRVGPGMPQGDGPAPIILVSTRG